MSGAAEPGRPEPTGAAVLSALLEHRRRFVAFVRKRVRNRDDADEILQAAFAKALERAPTIRDDERLVAWFYRVLRNAVVDHWRSRAAHDRAAATLAHETEPAITPDDAAEMCRCFEALLPALPADYARILKRVDLEETRPVDVAAEEGITPNLAMVRLHRARKALRQRLQESCRTCATHGCLDCTCGRTTQPTRSQ